MGSSGGTSSGQATRAGVAAAYTVLTGRPYGAGSTSTAAVSKDSWRYAPFRLDSAWVVDQLAVNTTVAATGGTAAMIFGLFVADSTGRPTTLQADWSGLGSIDLTATAGLLTLSTPSLA